MLDCVLIVVSYRSAHDVQGLLATVPAAVGPLTWRAVIVNNDPTDDLGPVAGACREAVLVEAGANLGYAGGINRGRASAPPSRWTVFLNPDLRLAPQAIARMAAHAGEESAVVPTIMDDAGTVQPSLRREPSILGALGDAVFGNRWPHRPGALSEIIRTCGSYEREGAVDWATGAALLVPTAAAERVGPWDNRFFLYSEETDYCRRLRASEVPVCFQPSAVVRHRGAGSGTSDALAALLQVNRVRYFRKWHGFSATAGFTAVVVLHNLLRASRPRSRAALRTLLSPGARAALPGGAR